MGRPKNYLREEALDAAVELFRRRGYAGSSIRDLCAAMGVPPRSLYAEFGDKQGLFVEALGADLERRERSYRNALGRAPLGFSRIEDYFRGLSFTDSGRSGLAAVAAVERESISEAARERLDEFHNRARQLFEDNVRCGQLSGQLPAGLDAESVAEMLLVFDQGLASAATSPPWRECLAGAVVALLTTLRASGSD